MVDVLARSSTRPSATRPGDGHRRCPGERDRVVAARDASSPGAGAPTPRARASPTAIPRPSTWRRCCRRARVVRAHARGASWSACGRASADPRSDRRGRPTRAAAPPRGEARGRPGARCGPTRCSSPRRSPSGSRRDRLASPPRRRAAAHRDRARRSAVLPSRASRSWRCPARAPRAWSRTMRRSTLSTDGADVPRRPAARRLRRGLWPELASRAWRSRRVTPICTPSATTDGSVRGRPATCATARSPC